MTLLTLPAHAVASRAGRALTGRLAQGVASKLVEQVAKRKLRVFGPDMLFHNATEMNHLASFLPRLHAAFSDDR